MTLAEAFPNGPDAWLQQRIKDLMATKTDALTYQLCVNASTPTTHVFRDVLWELHCTKLALNQFFIVCAAYANS